MKYLLPSGFALCAVLVSGDVYMHMPRGSNNRLNEQSANRANGNRLFDSQNNNRGGYNVGDISDKAFNQNGGNANGARFNTELNEDQYSFVYYEGSIATIEWTAQHGCGGNEDNDPHKTNCNMVIQYTCNTDNGKIADKAMRVELKDGRNTNTPDEPNNRGDADSKKSQNDNNKRGRMESEHYYYECKNRARNKGLFLADQNLKGNSQKYTRQNPNGNRRGLECPEERDYYPYWNPSPWVDVAYLTDNVQDCNDNLSVVKNSMNVRKVYKCTGADTAEIFAALTEEACDEAGGTWEGFSHQVPAPVCQQADWSRVNHLGNGREGQPLTFNWTIPELSKLGQYFDTKNNQFAKCALRLRYNISTDDYDVRNTDASSNDDPNNGVISPVQNNPTVDIGANQQGLRLALNTAQTGRTFQDRSHTFYISKRPLGITNKVVNLNVRGKRGNIVQTFPAVEYDFVPNDLRVQEGDWVHFQWTGSNTHNNGKNGGDGQTGDAGEGTGGTDRNNIVASYDASVNYPLPLDSDNEELKKRNLFFHGFDCYKHTMNGDNYYNIASSPVKKLTQTEAALYMASSGYYQSEADVNNKAEMNVLLNNAPASLVSGLICQARRSGQYHYFCSRNNNFSNRSEKGVITIYPGPIIGG